STSVRREPRADSMKRGVPPTEPNARTGEFTPPGVTARAPSKRRAELSVCWFEVRWGVVTQPIVGKRRRPGHTRPAPCPGGRAGQWAGAGCGPAPPSIAGRHPAGHAAGQRGADGAAARDPAEAAREPL